MERDKIISITIAGVLVAGIIPFGIFIYTTQLNNQLEGYIFTDSLGREVLVPYQPNRIISLSPSITETLYALNVENRVVGVSDDCNYPLNVFDKPKMGRYSTPNLESIAALNPDLIISSYSSWSAEKIATIESLGYSFIIITASTINDSIDNIGIIANLTNVDSKGIELINSLKTDLETITNETEVLTNGQLKSVYFELFKTVNGVGAVMVLSHLNNMIKLAGGTNIFDNGTLERYMVVSHEAVIYGDPEFIFVAPMGRTSYNFAAFEADFEDRKINLGYGPIDAINTNDVYLVDDDIFLRKGPRIVQGLENLTRYLHPGLL